jgi:thiamine pyrophosphate-dependent acetolactate synthase large subunit-like protein
MERKTMRVTGGEAVVRTLERLGVEVVFGIPGVHTLAIYDALYSSPIRHVLARHEQGAGFMADGYARVSGKPGVAIVITGPGVTNIATAIGEAYADSSPVVVIASNVEQAWQGQMLGHLHDCKDQLGIMRVVTKWADRARSVEDVPRLLRTAFAEAVSGRRRRRIWRFPWMFSMVLAKSSWLTSHRCRWSAPNRGDRPSSWQLA